MRHWLVVFCLAAAGCGNGGGGPINSSPPPDDTMRLVITNVAAVNISADSATITWNTDKVANSAVEYGPTQGYGSTVSDPNIVRNHAIRINSLSPGTSYHYRVWSSAGGI